MGIDVYTASLAVHLRNVDGATASALRAGDRHPLTREGLRAASAAAGPGSGRLDFVRAYLLARRVGRALEVAAGNPLGSTGPFLHQDPDALDARRWHVLQAVALAAEQGASVEDALASIEPDGTLEAGFLDAAWDGFPGIAFARAVELGNALVFPTEAPASFAVGRIAVSSVGEGRAFLTALTGRLSLSPAVLEEDSHDGEMSEALDGILYNLRLLAFHVEEASRSGRPLGVWG